MRTAAAWSFPCGGCFFCGQAAPMLFESTLGYALLGFGQKKNSSIFTTLEFLVGAGGLRKPCI